MTVYAAGGESDAALPGFWERHWADSEARARRATTVLLLDEIHYLDDWAKQLKGYWDHLRRRTNSSPHSRNGLIRTPGHDGTARESGWALRTVDP